VINGMTSAQVQAAAAAKANPNNGTVNDQTVVNGLQLSDPSSVNQAPGLVPYYNTQNPSPGGASIPSGTVLVPGTWSGVSGVSQSVSGPATAPSSAAVTITQNAQSAYLYWSHFNVGAKTSLKFAQLGNTGSAGTWIAFNKVMTASDPSHIFGTINSPGQVYILNQGGILFHAGSTVNVHSLVAATLPINQNLAGDHLDGVTANGIVNFAKSSSGSVPKQFLFTALDKASFDPNSKGHVTVSTASPIGDVVMERGASIVSQPDSSGTGGLVALVGPNVRNAGSISTANGQTILAAGLQVALLPHPSSDPSLRGLDVVIGQVVSGNVRTVSVETHSDTTGSTGSARNDGLIEAMEGDVTIAGKSVSQYGVVDSSTSVSFNGRVDLLANYNAIINQAYTADGVNGVPILWKQTGTVRMGPDSVMRILPEWGSSATINGTQLALNSVVSVVGANIDIGSGSILLAPGAAATPNALDETSALLANGVTVSAGGWTDTGSAALPNPVLYHTQGQIFVEQGATIDVSGSTGVNVDSLQNFITLQLRGSELANSPLQRNGVERGKNITVDIRNSGIFNGKYWVGTPLGDVTGYIGLIQKTVSQLTTAGGSVSLAAGDAVVLQPGSSINVSGGWVHYSGGSFATTKLIDSYGQVIDISKTTPDQVYTSIQQSPRAIYESPYVSGGNGGSLSIQSASMTLDSAVYGLMVTGSRQLRTTPGGSSSSLPVRAALRLTFAEDNGVLIPGSVVSVSPYAPSVKFVHGSQAPVSSPQLDVNGDPLTINDVNGNPKFLTLPQSRTGAVLIDPEISSFAGFGRITINNHDGAVSLPSGTLLQLGDYGSLSLSASTITMGGRVSAPSGSISLTAEGVSFDLQNAYTMFLNRGNTREAFQNVYTTALGETVLGMTDSSGIFSILHKNGSTSIPVSGSLTPDSGGSLLVASGAVIDVSGRIVNDSPTSSSYGTTPLVISGGLVSFSGLSTTVSGRIAVNGGVHVSTRTAVSYGNAGSIKISGGGDPECSNIHSGSLSLDQARLEGYAGLSPNGTASATPGSLFLTAPFIVLGGSSDPGGLSLSSSFFDQGGFSTFSLTGIGKGIQIGDAGYEHAVTIASGTVIDPKIMIQRLLYQEGGYVLAPHVAGRGLGYAPKISLTAAGLTDSSLPAGSQLLVRGDLLQSVGSSIILRPGVTISQGVAVAHAGSATFKGMTVDVEGSITVPGGSISLSTGGSLPKNTLGDDTIYTTLMLGSSARLSSSGKAIYVPDPTVLRSRFGTVLAGGTISLKGNLVALSGSQIDASGATGVFSDPVSGRGDSFRSDTAGGTINLTGAQALYSDALLTATSGGKAAPGGTLLLFSGSGPAASATSMTLLLTAGGLTVSGSPAIAGALANPSGDLLSNGGGHVALSSFGSGGFGAMTLGGNVLFDVPVSGSMALTVPGMLRVATGGILQIASSAGAHNPSLSLSGDYVAMGQAFASPLAPGASSLTTIFGNAANPLYAPPTWGTATLHVSAGSLLDQGNLSLLGTGSAHLLSGGEIRGDGTFAMAGDLTLRASQIYPVTDTLFTVVAFNHNSFGNATGASGAGITPGSITVYKGSSGSTPLSAGGTLSLFASSLTIGGNLLAPAGTIILGSTSGTSNPKDPMSGLTAPNTSSIKLTAGSLLSLSPSTLPVPYGTSADGTVWIDPSGTDITTTGPHTKTISLKGASVTLDNASGSLAAAQVDTQGGGDLAALQWISGLGGTINLLATPQIYNGSASLGAISVSAGGVYSYEGSVWAARQDNSTLPAVGPDWTQIAQTYAILPGNSFAAAPTGYADGTLGVGSRIQISGGGGLAAGSYTLLPAIYGSLPGAWLISVSSLNRNTATPYAQHRFDGTVLVSGSIYNGLDTSITPNANTALFVLTPPSQLLYDPANPKGPGVLNYQNLSASTFFSSKAVPQSVNAGNFTVSAGSSLSIGGIVNSVGSAGGRGGLVSLSLAGGNFQIGGSGSSGSTFLDPFVLNQWRYGGLLLGGTFGTALSDGTPLLTVTANSVSVGDHILLSGTDVILSALQSVSLGVGSSLTASGSSLSPVESITVNGNGALIRVSSDAAASVTRSVQNSSSSVTETISAGVTLSGNSVTIDSNGKTLIDQSAQILPGSNLLNLYLSGGAVAMKFDPSVSQADISHYDANSLLLSGTLLEKIQTASSLDLKSYSTLDLFGSTASLSGAAFGSTAITKLGLHAGEIRGFDLGGGIDQLSASSILLDNSQGASAPSPVTASADGVLKLTAPLVSLGVNTLAIDQFASVVINASGGFQGTASSSALAVAGTTHSLAGLEIVTPIVTATSGSSMNLQSSGAMLLQTSHTPKAIDAGSGASLTFTAPSIDVETEVSTPSGSISLHATAANVTVGASSSASLDVRGVLLQQLNVTTTEDAGLISLTADHGNVTLGNLASLNLKASGPSSAGSLRVSAANGILSIDPSTIIMAAGGSSGGKNGTFSLTALTLNPSGSGSSRLSTLAPQLSAAGFDKSISIELRSGDLSVDSSMRVLLISLITDQGSIDVLNGKTLDASGVTGGSISLQSSGSVILESGSNLNAHGDTYTASGKGGSVFLSAGAETGGVINSSALLYLLSGSTIDLGVTAAPASIQDLGGKLHLRAPLVIDGSGNVTSAQVGSLSSAVTGASSIALEGYMLYDITADTGNGGDMKASIPLIQGRLAGTQPVSAQMTQDIANFYGGGGAAALQSQLLAELQTANSSMASSIFNLAPGVEIINRQGDLKLNTDWDFGTVRAGANSAPGFLTLRSSGNITFNASLSDGFAAYYYTSSSPVNQCKTLPSGAVDKATLMSLNPSLPAGFQSWSYQITAGSDLASAAPSSLSVTSPGDVNLGVPQTIAFPGNKTPTSTLLEDSYQVIRTGTGDISVGASGNIRLWNQFATIYTAGVGVADPTLGNTFDVPVPFFTGLNQVTPQYGSSQQEPFKTTAMFSYAGGNVQLNAGGNIEHVTGTLSSPQPDSSAQLPTGWLDRRGAIDPATGKFIVISDTQYRTIESASTSWWVDFSNFFEGIGALGGGDVILNAGGNVSNVDAVIPTNYRMPGHQANAPASASSTILPNSANGIELGGGNLSVTSGNNIDAGVYYVERGNASLSAGGSIITNPTRDPQLPGAVSNVGDLTAQGIVTSDPLSYLPTTFFLGKGNISVQARGSVLMGPVANPFLLPEGINNSFWYKTYFSTYAADDKVSVLSSGNNVTFRTGAINPSQGGAMKTTPLLESWISQNSMPSGQFYLAQYEPWIASDEKSFPSSLQALVALMPPTLIARAPSGDIVLQGNINLSPSGVGELSLVAGGSIQGLSPAGVSSIPPGAKTAAGLTPTWASSVLNLSDANPSSIPGVSDPLSIRGYLAGQDEQKGTSFQGTIFSNGNTPDQLFSSLEALFAESGSTQGTYATLQTKLVLHDTIHASDNVPLQIVGVAGDVSGFTLYSPKLANVLAGGSITDVGLYIQNINPSDVSIVSAGGNIIAYDPTSTLHGLAQAAVSGFTPDAANQYLQTITQSGDIQISGPGTLEVLAGGNVDLGNGANYSDGTGVGITSIGNARNPSLIFTGADLIVSSGVSLNAGLSSGNLNADNLIFKAQQMPDAAKYYSDLLTTLQQEGFDDPLVTLLQQAGSLAGIENAGLTPDQKARLALSLFYIVLRDSGRDHNNLKSLNYGTYAAGEKAIADFIGNSSSGNIITWSRDIRSKSGGSISILAPDGGLSMASTATGSSLAPPGIVTEHGGAIEIYAQQNVSLGIGRIFTLRGGDIIIWSELGNIAAGASAKTVASAPPTRVLIDPQSGAIETDLAGLATGGGIGVLATVKDAPVGNVDLIAVSGIIDAGDAGIRSSGNLNLAATAILNADNIVVAGLSVGVPPPVTSAAPAAAPPVAAPPAAAPSSAASTAAAAASSAANTGAAAGAANQGDDVPSIISIDILGYGGGDGDDEDLRKKKAADTAVTPAQASL